MTVHLKLRCIYCIPAVTDVVHIQRFMLAILSVMQLISMMDIKEIAPEFCRVCKMDHCISIKLKSDGRVYLTSNVSPSTGILI